MILRLIPSRFRPQKEGERGMVMIMTALIMFFLLIPIVGLAIDSGVAFAVRVRLQTAVDGAALAAARSLSRGIALSAQRASAENTATRVYNANMAGAWSPLNNQTMTITWPTPPPKTTIVRVAGGVDAPTYFMRILGFNSVRIEATGEASRRDVNIMMVLDRSGSIQDAGACDDLQAASKNFVDQFVDGRDRIGLITYGTTYRVDFQPAFDFRSAGTNIPTIIDQIRCRGNTNSGSAYWQGYQRLAALNEPNTLNVILFFTDGLPNTVHLNQIPIRRTGSPVSTCAGSLGNFMEGVITNTNPPDGVWQWIEPSIPARNPDKVWIPSSQRTGCTFDNNSSGNNLNADFWGLAPTNNEVDAYGTALTGYRSVSRTNGYIRINHQATLTAVGQNVLDNAARRVRTLSAASGLDVYTYSIGLGAGIDATLLKRVANTQDSPTYDSTKPQGSFVYAANETQLAQAFMQLASEILRISY
jgi:hypothetical protein